MPVYKDECVYTFDNQESPHGVDVCLTCFIGTSPDPDHDFTKYHSRVTGHTAFLNLRKIPLASPSKAEQQLDHQPKKLAIQEADDADKFEHVKTFKTLASDSERDFEQAIKTVLQADSYTKTQQTEAWELELQPCEHVAMLESMREGQRPQPLSSEALSHCSRCDLRENLWICLECGNMGCGRKQFDGSGGEGHALQHFEECHHPLAIKLGSITPDGHADVYCYACNEDVKDPKVREHLAHWGIDIAQRVKTEKSMTELQLEQNMAWDFTSSDQGEVVNGKGFTGLKNLGNSCYMNSTLQSLFGIPEFSATFAANDPLSGEPQNHESLRVQLNKLKEGLKSGRYEVVAPQMLKYLIGKEHAEFATARQQDAFEYLSYFLTKLAQHVDKSLIDRLFGFETERRIECKNCHVVRYIQAREESISVAVPIDELEGGKFRSVDMYEMLDTYTAEESVESKCPSCNSPDAVSGLKFKSFPKVLIVNARRFRIVNWVPQKVDVPVVVPNEPLRLDKYLSKGPQPDENVISNSEEGSGDADDFVPDPVKLEMLQSMGFDSAQCAVALKLAKERGYGDGDFEAAIEIIVSGEALEAAQSAPASRGAGGKGACDPEALATLESMGFTPEQAEAALQNNDSNVESAVEWLFAGKFDELAAAGAAAPASAPAGSREEPSQEAATLGDATLPASYELSSVICHKGASVHVGHYVAALREHGEMYLYNDEKVSKGTNADELQNFAYIYMFKRV